MANFQEIDQANLFLPLTHPNSQMCIRIYIFKYKKTKPKITRQKAKETKEEKSISVGYITGYNDIVCKLALCTFNLLN